jgi:hypothetical protein
MSCTAGKGISVAGRAGVPSGNPIGAGKSASCEPQADSAAAANAATIIVAAPDRRVRLPDVALKARVRPCCLPLRENARAFLKSSQTQWIVGHR